MRTVLALTLAALLPAAALADRMVTDDTGRTVAVPDSPERVVVLHEPLLGVPIADLGVAPVGSYGRDAGGGTLMSVDFYREVLGNDAPRPPGVGALGNLDLERLRMLHPDLILGTEHDIDKADQLSSVAPVYLQNASTGKVRGFGTEAALARLLGREDVFAARKDAYLGRVEAVRAALPDAPGTYLALFLTDQINAVGEMSGAVQAIEDLGYERLDLGTGGDRAGMGSTLLVPLSAEVVGRLDPDLLLVMNSYLGAGRDEAGIRAALDRILPGWDRFLKPAREGRILFLDSAKVTTPTVASAEHMLDAVETWAQGR
ncbi:ABC transporter substrate-binding protein [Rhodovulum visakhapatnamense]|uniref:Iron complex transport system substrate-binding protein n=1 Tax=Rhodovulum visakhapatnamense TaxID=364297 RepID=A0A4R8G188_9RHOB|nr:ABC transporter substrate-binding protein [Rhodovulum visakhapatnamense]TDX33285.1 iron complex transport system substrate-binding protein [Rhodovulum visakhapatnamense]